MDDQPATTLYGETPEEKKSTPETEIELNSDNTKALDSHNTQKILMKNIGLASKVRAE